VSTNHLCPRCGEDEMQAHDAAWGMCPRCGYTCCLDDLERLATRSASSVLNREIHECLAEDRRRGQRGGSGDKGPKKEDKLGRRSLSQMNWSEEQDTIAGRTSSKMECKDTWLSVRGIPEGISGETVRKAIERKLGL
jgi:hypothetical protein